MNLKAEQCEPVSSKSVRVTDQELAGLINEIPDWRPVVSGNKPKLTREFKFDNFRQALDFTIKVGELAEEQDHHPEIVTSYGQTTVLWWTHAIGGLHHNDFICAAKTDAIAENMKKN